MAETFDANLFVAVCAAVSGPRWEMFIGVANGCWPAMFPVPGGAHAVVVLPGPVCVLVLGQETRRSQYAHPAYALSRTHLWEHARRVASTLANAHIVRFAESYFETLTLPSATGAHAVTRAAIPISVHAARNILSGRTVPEPTVLDRALVWRTIPHLWLAATAPEASPRAQHAGAEWAKALCEGLHVDYRQAYTRAASATGPDTDTEALAVLVQLTAHLPEYEDVWATLLG